MEVSLAFFDQPTFDKDVADADARLRRVVRRVVDQSQQASRCRSSTLGPPGAFKAKIDELSETIKNTGQIDLRKDILGHLGPRMVAYLAPGRSAATNDDSLEAALKNGLTPSAAVTAMQSFFPKLTLVAEVDDPEAFGKGLDTLMIAINNELEAQAMETRRPKTRRPNSRRPPAGTARQAGGRQRGGDRTKRRRILSYPQVQLRYPARPSRLFS